MIYMTTSSRESARNLIFGYNKGEEDRMLESLAEWYGRAENRVYVCHYM